MILREFLQKRGGFAVLYENFEVIISSILVAVISAIIMYSIVRMAMTLVNDFFSSARFVEETVIKDTFGSILGILIMIEFNHSIALGIRRRSGVIQVRVIVVIAIIVIARKLILMDYAITNQATLLGLGGLALALGGLYWLLGDTDRRRRVANPADLPDRPSARIADPPPRNE